MGRDVVEAIERARNEAKAASEAIDVNTATQSDADNGQAESPGSPSGVIDFSRS